MIWTDVVLSYIVVLFLWSALAKGTRLRQLGETVRTYGIRTGPMARLVALCVMVSEWLVVLMSPFPLTQRAALGLAAALLVAFATAGASRQRKEGAVECGCLGSGSGLLLTPATTVANAVSAAVALGATVVIAPRPIVVPSLPIGLLLAGTYWLTLYAFSVMTRMSETAAVNQGERAT